MTTGTVVQPWLLLTRRTWASPRTSRGQVCRERCNEFHLKNWFHPPSHLQMKNWYQPPFHHHLQNHCRHRLLRSPIVVQWEEPVPRFEVVARLPRQCWLRIVTFLSQWFHVAFMCPLSCIVYTICYTYHSWTYLPAHSEWLLRARNRPGFYFQHKCTWTKLVSVVSSLSIHNHLNPMSTSLISLLVSVGMALRRAYRPIEDPRGIENENWKVSQWTKDHHRCISTLCLNVSVLCSWMYWMYHNYVPECSTMYLNVSLLCTWM